MTVSTPMDSVNNICNVGEPAGGRITLYFDWPTSVNQINSRDPHWPENRIIVSKSTGEASLVAKAGVQLLGSTVHGVASMEHRELMLPQSPVVD